MRPDAPRIAVPLDEEGYLVNPADWSENIAAELARGEDVALGDTHWAVIRFMREYYEQHHIAPDARHVLRFLAETRAADRNELFRLFPYGYVKQACKIAGMRKPRAWSTG
jgi:TusE/DsrC/DsvC family sulfur relay protein